MRCRASYPGQDDVRVDLPMPRPGGLKTVLAQSLTVFLLVENRQLFRVQGQSQEPDRRKSLGDGEGPRFGTSDGEPSTSTK
jgi:hypothetical protein